MDIINWIKEQQQSLINSSYSSEKTNLWVPGLELNGFLFMGIKGREKRHSWEFQLIC